MGSGNLCSCGDLEGGNGVAATFLPPLTSAHTGKTGMRVSGAPVPLLQTSGQQEALLVEDDVSESCIVALTYVLELSRARGGLKGGSSLGGSVLQ